MDAITMMLALLALPHPAWAQGGASVLTLEESIELARQNNPDFRIQENDRVSADWAVRSAYGDLLPSANASMGLGYTASGERRFGTVGLGEQPAMYSSSYSLGVSYSLSAAEVLEPARARAQALAVDDIGLWGAAVARRARWVAAGRPRRAAPAAD